MGDSKLLALKSQKANCDAIPETSFGNKALKKACHASVDAKIKGKARPKRDRTGWSDSDDEDWTPC